MSTPNLREWTDAWRLEQGRDPTNEEITNLFVNADADCPAYNEWADRWRLEHGRWPTHEDIEHYWYADGDKA